MSVVAMKLLTIAGPLEQFDEVVSSCVLDQEFHPEHAIRFSKRGYRKDGDIINIPLYLARKTKELL